MKRALAGSIVVANVLLASGAIAQAPQDDCRLLPSRYIQLTAQQEYVIKENVKDLHVDRVDRSKGFQVGEKLPSGIETHASRVIEMVFLLLDFGSDGHLISGAPIGFRKTAQINLPVGPMQRR
jgi:hypothetical protein